MAFDDMGGHWTAVRDGAREGTLRKTGDDVRDIVQRWDQLMRFASLKLGADIGVDVQHVVPRAQNEPKARTAHLTDSLVGTGTLDGTLRIPGAAGNLAVTADLRARQTAISADISAPSDRGNKARATWLVRQLGPDTPAGIVIEAWPRHARTPLTATLAQAREDASVLVDPEKRDTLRFRLTLRSEMGQNRRDGGRSPGFIQVVMSLLRTFYRDVLQQVTLWTPPAPQARTGQPVELVHEPIEDQEELAEAITAARDEVTEQTGPSGTTASPDEGSETSAEPEDEDPIWEPSADAHEPEPDEDLVAAPTPSLEITVPEPSDSPLAARERFVGSLPESSGYSHDEWPD